MNMQRTRYTNTRSAMAKNLLSLVTRLRFGLTLRRSPLKTGEMLYGKFRANELLSAPTRGVLLQYLQWFEEQTLLTGSKLSIPIWYDDTIKIYGETNGLSAFWQHLALLFGRSSVLPVAALRHPRGGCLSLRPHRPLAEH